MNKRYLLTIGLLLASYALFSQVENTNAIIDWRQHNLTKYNKFLVNPTYSYVRNDTKAVSFWSRIQWTGIENPPQTYLLSYSGKVSENSGAGLGLYQQNYGLFIDTGLLLNYAHAFKFTDNVTLTVGMNTTLFRRKINKDEISATEPNPLILEYQDDFLTAVMPGINLSVNNFDIGIYAENIFDYNFNDSNTVTNFSDKIFSGQLGYTKSFTEAIGFMEEAKWRSLVYGKTQPNSDFQFGFNSMLDLPYTGWLQAGYNTTFGVSGGVGVKISDEISIGIVYERGTNNSYGGTYEAIASIELGPKKMRKNAAPSGGKAVTSKNVNEEDYISSEEIKKRREADADRIINDSLEEKVAENSKSSSDVSSKNVLYGGEVSSNNSSDALIEEKSNIALVKNSNTSEVNSVEKTDVAAEVNNAEKSVARQDDSSISEVKKSNPEKISTSAVVENKSSEEKTVTKTTNEVGTVTGYAIYNEDAEDYVKAAQEALNEDVSIKAEESNTYQTSEVSNEVAENKMTVAQQMEAEEIEVAYQEFLRRSDSVTNAINSKTIDSTAITLEVFGENVSYKTINSAPGIEKGFYLVVNVFSQEDYFNDFNDKLKASGLEPKFFLNPENNYYYVYLYKANRYFTIKSMQENNINGTYFDDKWVLWVK